MIVTEEMKQLRLDCDAACRARMQLLGLHIPRPTDEEIREIVERVKARQE